MSDKSESKPQPADPAAKPGDDLSGGDTGWTRPVAQARDRHVGAWLTLLSLACFAFALRGPATRLFWRTRNSLAGPERATERTEDRFLAISYEGVSAGPDAEGVLTSAARFREHLEALRGAGYNPIGLDDVVAFRRDGAKLPRRAILVTFENTRKSTYFEATPELRAVRWRAVMGVVTRDVRENSQDSVLAPYLRNMVLDDTWDLACESDLGTTFIPVNSGGRTAAFLTSPKWIQEENRPERPEEFAARVRADHECAWSVFTNELGTAPSAFFFPLGNYGQYEERNRVLRTINLAAVAERYEIGFTLGSRALNTADTDPRRLNRLRVAPEWTGETLLARLEREWPVPAALGGEESRIPAERWSPDWGVLETEGRTVRLRALPAADPMRSDADATGGARAWISGTDGFREGSFEARFMLQRGEFHVYLPFTEDDDWLRIEVGDTGRATVRCCPHGGDPEAVASGVLSGVSDFRAVHSLLLTIRDGLLFARLDGESLFGGPVPLPGGAERSGILGAGVWADVPGLASTELMEVHVRPRADGLVTWTPALSRDTGHLSRALSRDAFRNTVVSPPWLDVHNGSSIAFTAPDREVLEIVVRTGRAKTMPSLVVHDVEALSPLDPENVAARAAKEGADGVFVDASGFPADRLPPLKDWMVRFHAALSRRGLALAIRFPAAVRQLAAVANFVSAVPGTLVVDDEGETPPGVDPAGVLSLMHVEPPASDDDLELFYQLSDYDASGQDAIPEAARLRQQGLKAYADGRYAEAAGFWEEWTAVSPDDAEAWALLGNARSRARNAPAAIDAYGRSLELSPGQVELALERARLLEQTGRDAESGELLDAYARVLPGDPRIAISQAMWLDRHHRRAAGRAMLRDIVAKDPANINARLTLQTLLDDPGERYANMHELLQVGATGRSGLLGFGHDIETAELLSCPEASVFFQFIRDTAANAPQESVREVYSDFLPIASTVAEPFDANHFSDSWAAFGTPLNAIVGAYDLKAASDMSEAYLRLRRSELLRDGFIEVTLSESVGAFWLYARRCSRSLVRFGFDGDGFLRIQTWRDGEMRTGDSRAWIRPAGDVTLRLEIRGDGAIGLVDGKPGFVTPLPVPEQIAYGWWSVAPFSPELGVARARISRISAGPLSSCIAVMRERDALRAADALDRIRPRTREVSAVAPVLFAQRQDGTIETEPLADLMPFRMFCSCYRIRLMPAVALDYESFADPRTLLKIIVANRLSGLVLLARVMPPDEWFEEMTSLLEQTASDLIVVASQKPIVPASPDPGEDAADARIREIGSVSVRELQRGSVLLHPTEAEWTLAPIPFREWPAFSPNDETAAPRIVVLPQTEPAGNAENEPAETTPPAAPETTGTAAPMTTDTAAPETAGPTGPETANP